MKIWSPTSRVLSRASRLPKTASGTQIFLVTGRPPTPLLTSTW